MKQKLQDRIDILKNSLSNTKSEKAKKAITQKINKLQGKLNYKPSAKELASSSKGKFVLEIPSKYARQMHAQLWKMKILPVVKKINGHTNIIVNNANNLNKAYKIYTTIAAGEKVPALNTISKKL